MRQPWSADQAHRRTSQYAGSPGRNALPSHDADYEKYAKNGLTITIGESKERNENHTVGHGTSVIGVWGNNFLDSAFCPTLNIVPPLGRSG